MSFAKRDPMFAVLPLNVPVPGLLEVIGLEAGGNG
jgi:hypothetical protein